MDIWKELRDEGVDSGLLDEVRRFREAHPLTPEAQERVPVPKYLYYGREVWESAAAALLCGEHLLLAGPKATGKNVLAEDLAALFGRPVWDVSMYVNVDAAALIGADTLKDGQVLSVSGDYERFVTIGGKQYHHILNPTTGYPSDSGLSSVAVVTRDGPTADALSTAFMVMGEDAARALRDSGTFSYEAVFFRSDGSVFVTDSADFQK